MVMHRWYLAAKSLLKDLRMSRLTERLKNVQIEPMIPGEWLNHDATKDLLLKVTV